MAAPPPASAWTEQWLEASLHAELGAPAVGANWLNSFIFGALSSAIASDGCVSSWFVQSGRANSNQAGEGWVGAYGQFSYNSSKLGVVDTVQFALEPLILRLQMAGVQVERRDRYPNGAYNGGGPIQKEEHRLSVGFPPLTYAAMRALWYPDGATKVVPFLLTAADRDYHRLDLATIAFAYLGDGHAWRGAHIAGLAFPANTAAENTNWCQLLSGGAFTGPSGVQHGPWQACITTPSPFIGVPAISPTAYRPAGAPRVAPGANQGRGGAYAAVAVDSFQAMLRDALVPAGPGCTISGHLYPPRPAPTRVFRDETYWRRAAQAPLYNPAQGIDVRAGPRGPYEGAQIIAAFFAGASGEAFLSTLTWGANLLSRRRGLSGLYHRCTGWHSTYFFDPREILPHMQDRVWEAAATARTSCSVNTSGRRCADLEAYLITHHLWVGAGAILRGLPYTYPSPPGTLPRLAQIVAWFVPACTTQCYTVLVTPTDAAIAANTAFTVTAWGRGH